MWKPIKDYEGMYEVSNLGEVRSLKKNKDGYILKLNQDKNGYKRITLYKNGIRKTRLIHQLVAETFLEKPIFENMDVNHINEIKIDNRVENLEYITRKQNINHGTRNKRMVETKNEIGKTKNGKAYGFMVACLDKNTKEIIKIYNSIMDVERDLNIHHSHIIKCCKGKAKTSGGFSWKYIE